MGKVKDYFSNVGDKVKTSMRVKLESPFLFAAIILVILIAFLVRISSAVYNEWIIHEFDCWAQYYAMNYVINNGWFNFLHWKNYQMWYPEGAYVDGLHIANLWMEVTSWQLLNAVGIPVTPFIVAFYFPPVMGSLTCIAIYYFGKEVLE